MPAFFNPLTRRWTAKKIVLLVFDLSITVVAAFLAVLAMWDYRPFWAQIKILKELWYLFPCTAAPIFLLIGFYDHMWVYASFQQYFVLAAGSVLQTLLVAGIMQAANKRLAFACYLLYCFLLIMATVSFRLLYRFMVNFARRRRNQKGHHLQQNRAGSARTEQLQLRVLVVGAGSAGSQIISELKTQQMQRIPVAIVDDNPLTHSYKNQGIMVVGGRNDIPRIVEEYDIDEILLAIPSAAPRDVREILKICHACKTKVRTIPFLPQLLSGQVLLNSVRDVEIEDLLGREQVKLDISGLQDLLKDKVALVTGGGGSIGSELARQIAAYQPRKLILLDFYENNLYELERELQAHHPHDLDLQCLIASVREKERLEEIFSQYRPDIVFHAAAHKHVPLMEDSKGEAVKNNIYGTANLADVAGRYGVSHMVLISTDKAVNPTNVMGASKRIAELVMVAANKKYQQSHFAMVRFGNVLDSNGSVIPIFKKQIKDKLPVTVTDPEITRYFMTIPEAVSLVIQAACYAQGGELFVLDMGEPVKIDDLARELIRLSGFEPGVDIEIKYIGLRPGEKMFEELILSRESMDKTLHEKIFVLKQNLERQALSEEVHKLRAILRCEQPEFAQFCAELIEELCQN